MKNKFFTIYDKLCAIFYLFIVIIGVMLCFDHGRSAGMGELFAVFVSVTAVFALKLLKRKNTDIDDGLGAIAFSGAMSVLSAVLLVVNILG